MCLQVLENFYQAYPGYFMIAMSCCSERSRMLYCYDCMIPFTPTPRLELPLKISLITHNLELRSKNTGQFQYIHDQWQLATPHSICPIILTFQLGWSVDGKVEQWVAGTLR